MSDLWRHKVRGSVYEILIDDASLQCSAAPAFEEMFEDDNWIVYRNVDTGAFSVRPTAEFHDGRFEKIEKYQKRTT